MTTSTVFKIFKDSEGDKIEIRSTLLKAMEKKKNISAHEIDHLPITLNDIVCKYDFVNTLKSNIVKKTFSNKVKSVFIESIHKWMNYCQISPQTSIKWDLNIWNYSPMIVESHTSDVLYFSRSIILATKMLFIQAKQIGPK